MPYDKDSIRQIYDRTDGRCHLCGKKLSLNNYASPGKKGAWEVEHSVPRSMGGTDHLNNLFPAHISCNRKKGTVTTQTARAWNGRQRAPLSKEKKKEVQISNTIFGGLAGGLLGLLGGPWGIVAGLMVGALIGNSLDPNKN